MWPFNKYLNKCINNPLETKKAAKLIETFGKNASKTKKPIKFIEKFGLMIGSQNINKKSEKFHKLVRSDTNLDRSVVVSNLQKIIKSVSMNTSSKNLSDVMSIVVAKNSITLNNASGTELNVSTNIEAVAENSVKVESISKNTTNVQNAMVNELKDSFKQSTTDLRNIVEGSKASEVTGQGFTAAENISGKALDTAGDILSLSIGSRVLKENTKEIDNQLITEIDIDSSFSLSKDVNINSVFENIMTNENISKCGSSTASENSINLSNLKYDKLTIGNPGDKLTATAKSTIDCLFSNENTTKMANNMTDKIEVIFDSIMEATDLHKIGEVAALGDATAATIAAGGDAAEKSIRAGGDAGSTLFTPLKIGLIVAGIVAVVIGIIIFAVMTNKSSSRQGYTQGASQGYTQGASQGYTQGASQGYDQGASQGYDQGASQGYNQGASQGYDQGTSQGYNQSY
jgi:hypothetical protein